MGPISTGRLYKVRKNACADSEVKHISLQQASRHSTATRIFEQKQKEAQPIETVYEPLDDNGEVTLLKVGLITGRTHQIRAHLASEGHPLAGDTKYGQDAFNRRYREKYQLKHQLLHAFRLSFPDGMEGRLSDLSGKCFRAPLPAQFERIIKEEKLGEKLL